TTRPISAGSIGVSSRDSGADGCIILSTRSFPEPLLQRPHGQRPLAQGPAGFDRGLRTGDGCNAGDAVLHRRGADLALVRAAAFARRRVDDERDLAILHAVDQVGAALAELGDLLDRNAVLAKDGRRASRGDHLITEA